jgi:hypothetical protein
LPTFSGFGGTGTSMSMWSGTTEPANIGASTCWFERLSGAQSRDWVVPTDCQRGTHQRMTGCSMSIAGRK